MRITAWLGLVPALLAASPALGAISVPRQGFYVDAGAGGMLGDVPLAAGLGWQGGIGAWWGRYDDEYALGRFTSVGVGARGGVWEGAPLAIVAEARKGTDIFVIGWHGFLAGGATFGDEGLGAVAEAGVGVKGRFRFSGPLVGYQLRVHGGATLGAEGVGALALLTLGVEIAAPFTAVREDE